jgi:poly(3-hydroxybutyrate) depolymerase
MVQGMLTRRQWLGAALAALAWSRAAEAASSHFLRRVIELDGTIAKRMTLITPKHMKGKVPLLVLLHGLGETHDPKLGVRAWPDLYGLADTYDRLREPPIERLFPKQAYWDEARLAEINASLDKKPFRGLAIACPFTPNVYKAPSRKAMLDEYADWIVDGVVARARREANVFTDSKHTYLDGCSLGGYVSIEVFLRKAKHFGAWGSVQGALGDHRVQGYAEGLAEVIAKHGKRAIHIETSKGDAFRRVNEQLSRLLKKAGVPHDFAMPPGPHNQPFLRDSGTLEMLLWYDRLPR